MPGLRSIKFHIHEGNIACSAPRCEHTLTIRPQLCPSPLPKAKCDGRALAHYHAHAFTGPLEGSISPPSDGLIHHPMRLTAPPRI